jgi:hypothetical protein
MKSVVMEPIFFTVIIGVIYQTIIDMKIMWLSVDQDLLKHQIEEHDKWKNKIGKHQGNEIQQHNNIFDTKGNFDDNAIYVPGYGISLSLTKAQIELQKIRTNIQYYSEYSFISFFRNNFFRKEFKCKWE